MLDDCDPVSSVCIDTPLAFQCVCTNGFENQGSGNIAINCGKWCQRYMQLEESGNI